MDEVKMVELIVPKVEVDEEKKLLESKKNLRELRSVTALNSWENDLYTDFEKAYGKYLFVPFAIPKIQPNDMNKFIEFFFTESKDAIKVKADMLSNAAPITTPSGLPGKPTRGWWNNSPVSPYKQITSIGGKHSDIWSDNEVPEIHQAFPELFEQIHEYMPFISRPDFKWFMWSANRDVPPHRDYGSQIDAPVGIRIMLYDNNPVQSLSLKLDPIDKPKDHYEWYPCTTPEDTNTFAWNNLRQKHKSFYTRGHRKILMIISAKEIGYITATKTGRKNLNWYVDLLDKSIAKYKDSCVIDTENDYTDYLAFDGTEPIQNVIPR